ncbi:MAG: hypothetical protein AAGN35_05525 [Bacteroidota bacterium]
MAKAGSSRGKKLLYYLRQMNPEELRQFSHWLASPLHENSPQLAAMLEILAHHLAHTPDAPLVASTFAPALSSDEPFAPEKASYIWIRLAALQSALYDFLAWEQAQTDTQLRHRNLFAALRRRGWDRYLPQIYKTALRELPAPPQALRFEAELGLETEMSAYLASEAAHGEDKHLDRVHRSLDYYFLLQKVKYACGGILEGDPGADPSQSAMLKAVLAYTGEHLNELPGVLVAYWNVFEMLHHEIRGDKEWAAELFLQFDALFRNPTDFSPEEAVDLFIHGQNFCILRYRQGDGRFVDHLLSLYERVLDSRAIFKDGQLSGQFYKNTVELMARLGRLTWAEQFVETYRNAIRHDSEAVIYRYNLAVIRFFQQDYRAAVNRLYNIISALDRFNMGVGARVYFCRSLWEAGEYDWLNSGLRAFDQHLRRNRNTKAGDPGFYREFVAFLRRASNAVTGNPSKKVPKLEALQEELAEAGSQNHFRWIRQKVSEQLAGETRS